MFSANGELADIINNVSIYSRPIHSLSHLSLYPVDPLMGTKQVSKGPIE